MPNQKLMNRWWVVVGALIIQVSLGAVYIWSVFQTPLKRAFPSWTETQVTLPAQIVLAVFALAVVFGGRLQDKLGPRKVATAGGIIVGLGLILAKFTGSAQSAAAVAWLIVVLFMLASIGAAWATHKIWLPDDKRGLIAGIAVVGFALGACFMGLPFRALLYDVMRIVESWSSGPELAWLVLTFSVLGGIGIGLAYVCPIATCVKWFPDKKGLITGLAVAGFGAGAFFFAPLARGLISGVKYELLGLKLFPLPELEVFNTFLALGVIFLITVVAGAQLLQNPPPGYVPAGWTPPQSPQGALRKEHFTPTEMLRTPAFWLLWLTFFAGCTAGLQVIMKTSPIWQSFGFGGMTPPISEADFLRVTGAGAMAVSILAIFNSLGRIFWGRVSDSIGRKATLVIIFLLCGVTMLALDTLRTYPLYLLGVCTVGLCFGGFLALYPAVTADFYGTKHMGANYGWMFLAFGAGGLFGPFLAAWLMKVVSTLPYQVTEAGTVVEKLFAIGDYRPAFLVAGIACLAAGGLCLLLRAPKLPLHAAPQTK